MEYTETTSTSWFSRLGSSFGGIGFGIVLILAGTGLLWWNEGDFVKTRDALNEAQGETVELTDVNRVDAALNGKLVHATGPADTQDVLKDPVFGIGGKGIAFARKVEFYQWTEQSRSEKRQKLGGGEETVTTYSYKTDWVGHRVDSQQFHAPEARTQHANMVLLAVEDQTQHAANVSFGAYRLPALLIRSIGGAQPFTTTLDAAVREKLTRDVLRARPELVPFHTTNMDRVPFERLPQVIHEQGGTLYIGASPAAPQVGDVRVTFTMTPPATVSIIARTRGDTFEPFRAANGKSVSALAMGEVSMDNMFANKHSGNENPVFSCSVEERFQTEIQSVPGSVSSLEKSAEICDEDEDRMCIFRLQKRHDLFFQAPGNLFFPKGTSHALFLFIIPEASVITAEQINLSVFHKSTAQQDLQEILLSAFSFAGDQETGRAADIDRINSCILNAVSGRKKIR